MITDMDENDIIFPEDDFDTDDDLGDLDSEL